MRSLMLLLALRLVATEKLDRTYLPPPGSKYSGGSAGDLQVPLEFPKEYYTTTAPFTLGQKDGIISPDDTKLVPGTQRGPGPNYQEPFQDLVPVTPANKPKNLFQNSYQLPTTTTSYAFTQTTTFPPGEGFETTISPVSGFPIEGNLSEQTGLVNQPLIQGQIYPQSSGQNYPGFIQTGSPFAQIPGFVPIPGTNIPGSQLPTLTGQNVFSGRPGYQPSQNQYQQSFPSSTVSPIPGSVVTPGTTSFPYGQGYSQHLGVQPPRQYNQQGIFSSTPSPGYETTQSYNNIGNLNSIPGVITRKPGQRPVQIKQQIPTSVVSSQSNTQYVDTYGNVQSSPDRTTSQQVQAQYPQFTGQPNTIFSPEPSQYKGDLNSIRGVATPGSISTPQQGNERFQFTDQQKPFSTTRPQAITPGSIIDEPGRQGPQYIGQQSYFPKANSQENISGSIITQQQAGHQSPYGVQQGVPSFGIPQGPSLVTTGSSDFQQHSGEPLQFTDYQKGYPAGIPQGSNIFGSGQTISQQPELQKTQFANQKGIYPLTGVSQETASFTPFTQQSELYQQQQPIRQQTQFSKQENEFSPTRGSQIPGFTGFSPQQKDAQQPPFIGQQGLISSTGISQTLPPNYGTGSQPGEKFSNIQGNIPSGTISPQGSLLDQKPVLEAQPGNQPGSQQSIVPYGQPQTTQDSRILSQQMTTARPSQDSPNIYGSGSFVPSSTITPNYNQPYFSTTPSPVSSYGSSSGSMFQSSPLGFDTVMPSSTAKPYPQRPQAESDRNAEIINYENILTPEGFAYTFDTTNGIHADENGTAIDGVKANGSYSYIGDDGKRYSVVYSADENGFRPRGDHLPTPPPVPEAIQRVIEQAARDKEAGISHDGFYDEAKYGHKKYQRPKHRRPQISQLQDKIIANGVDIPEDNEKYHKEKDTRKDDSQYGRKPAIANEDKYLDKDEDEDETISTDSGEVNINAVTEKSIEKQQNKYLSRKPLKKKPGQNRYKESGEDSVSESEEEQEQIYNNKKTKTERPYGHRDSIKHRTGTYFTLKEDTSTDKHKSGPQIDDKKIYLESEEETDEQTNQNYNKNLRFPSKVKGTKYSEIEDMKRIDVPDYFEYRQRNITRRPQGMKQPGTITRHEENFEGNAEGSHAQLHRKRKPVNGLLKTNEMQYSITENTENYFKERSEPDQQKQIISDKFKGLRRPGMTNTRYEQHPSLASQKEEYESVDYSEGLTFEDKGRPQYRPDSENRESYPEQTLDKETGYHYIPPQNKFDQVANNFPSRIREEAEKPKKSSSKNEDSDNKTTIQPFITPNVSRDENVSYEESEENSPSNKPEYTYSKVSGYSKPGETYKNIDSDYYDQENNSDLDVGDELPMSNRMRLVKPSKVNSAQTQKTTDGNQYPPESKMAKKELPGPKGGLRYLPHSNMSTKGKRPGQDFSQLTTRSEYSSVSSTTPIPSGRPNRPGSKQPSFNDENDDQLQYQTNEPPDTTGIEDYSEEMTQTRFSTPSLSSKKPMSTPRHPDSKMPTTVTIPGPTFISSSRTTPRPIYNYSDGSAMIGSPNIRPGISESVFSRPSSRPGIVYTTSAPASELTKTGSTANLTSRPTEEYYPKQNQVTFTHLPGSISSDRRPNYPDRSLAGSASARPVSGISGLGKQDHPSTTYRPNYSIIDQQERENVDDFGRPIHKGTVAGSKRPSNIAPSQKGSTFGQPSTVIYQDMGLFKPEQINRVDNFKPSERRFGDQDHVSPGFKPLEFGPSSVTTPGYLGPRPTDQVLGEDFSGPKQPQIFDPNTGYYYK